MHTSTSTPYLYLQLQDAVFDIALQTHSAMTTYLSSLTLPAFIFEQPAASILLPVIAGSAIGYSLSPKETQASYNALRQPPGRPPGWVFGPAWTTLYTLMGYGK